MRAPLLLLALSCTALAPAAALAARDAVIQLHMGYGTPAGYVITGRVIDDKGVRPPAVHRTAADNLIDSLKVLDSDEVEDAVVEITVAGARVRTKTDHDGNFMARARGLEERLPLGEVATSARLVDGRGWRAPVAHGLLRVLPDDEAHVVVLSDYDDTVVESGVKNKITMGMGAVFRNAAQLEPVPGVSVAYRRALAAGAKGMFFLSGSPLSFYPRVAFFLRKNDIPGGPLLLKDFGKVNPFEQLDYKRGRLDQLLEVLPKTRFVLVGDSGEHDPEIYAGLRRDHPERVLGIVIRRVKGDESAPDRFRAMTVVDDYAATPDVVADYVERGLVDIAASRPAAPEDAVTESDVSAEREGAEESEADDRVVEAADADAGPTD